MEWNPLVPELPVNDFLASKRFYIEVLGFTLNFERAEEGFGYFDLGGAQVMLLQSTAPVAQPSGARLHFQVEIEALEPLLTRLRQAGVALVTPVSENWYRAEEVLHGQREFFVSDPDGYLYRFFEYLGERIAG